MARYFLDTSALIKNYHVESGTPDVQRIMTEPGAELLISRLALVETLSGFAAKVRTGVFPVQEFQRLRGLFLADVKRRLLRPLRGCSTPTTSSPGTSSRRMRRPANFGPSTLFNSP